MAIIDEARKAIEKVCDEFELEPETGFPLGEALEALDRIERRETGVEGI